MAPRRRRRPDHGGFTLVEVLVGMTVAGIAIAAGFGTLAFVQDRADQAEVATAAALEGAATRGLLTEWLGGARSRAPNRGERFQGLDGQSLGLSSDELIFPTTARTPLSVGTPVVRLYIDMADSTPERGLVAELTERAIDLPHRVELVPQAAGLEVRYLPEAAEAVEWLPSWIGSDDLPRAVEITLTPARGDSLPPLLRLPIRVALEAAR